MSCQYCRNSEPTTCGDCHEDQLILTRDDAERVKPLIEVAYRNIKARGTRDKAIERIIKLIDNILEE